MPTIFQHIYTRFCEDPVAAFLVSPEPYLDDILSEDGIEQAAKVVGNLTNMSMTMYIYRKVDFKPKEFVDVDPLHTKIETAYRKISAFKCTQKSKTRKNKIYEMLEWSSMESTKIVLLLFVN